MVMKKLCKKLLRDIRHSLGQFAAIVIVSAIGVSLLTGISVTYGSLKSMTDNFYGQSHLADLSAYYLGIDDAGIDTIKHISGVADAYGRATLNASGNGSDFLVHTISQDDKINMTTLRSGKIPQSDQECMVDEAYAKANHLSVGSGLSAVIGGKDYRFTISGTCNSAEHVYLVEDPAKNPMPNHKTYGLLYIDTSMIQNLRGSASYNEVLITLKKSADPEAVKSAVESATSNYRLGQITMQKDQPSYSQLQSDIDTLHAFSTSFPYIFFLVAAAILFISMSRTIQNERGQIGIMKALGIKTPFITLHYLGYPVLSGLAGSLLGNLLGVLVFPPVLFGTYALLYTFPSVVVSGYGFYVMASTVVVLLFGVAATLLSTHRTLKETPARCMQPVPPKKVHKIFLEKRETFWSRLPYKYKLILRNILMGKRRAILSSIGIIGCVGVLLCGFGFKDSTALLYVTQFNKNQRFDDMVTLSAPIPYASPLPFHSDNIARADEISLIPANLALSRDIGAVLYVLPQHNSSIRLYDSRGSLLAMPEDGIIFPYKLAQQYHIKAGDTVSVTLESQLYGNKSIRAKVAAIGVEYLSQDIYTSYSYLQSIGVTPDINGYYVTLKDKAQEHQTDSLLSHVDHVKSVASQADLKKSFSSMMKLMDTLMAIMIIMSGALALAVIFNISSINIFERRRDIATLKVLGYHRKEINSLIYIENLLITAFGSIWGIGFGALIYQYLLKVIVSADMYLPYRITADMVFYSLLLAFAFTLLTNFLLRGKIRRIDMVESLKSVE